MLLACITSWFFAPRYWLISLALLVGSAIYSLHVATLQQSIIADLALSRSDVSIEAIVTSDVKRTQHRVRGSTLDRPQSSFMVRVVSIRNNHVTYRVRLPARVLSKEDLQLIPGDRISADGTMIITRERRVAGTLITSSSPIRIAMAGSLSQGLSQIRSEFRVLAERFNNDAGSLIPGMILGDTSLQSEEFTQQMRKSGLSHLTAVSGANFAIVSAVVFWLSRLVFPAMLPRIVLTSAFLGIFLLLVRPSPSVLRAGVMAAVILLARATGNTRSAISALSAAIGLLLLLDPFQAHDPGFVLSVLATGGLIFLAPVIKRHLEPFLPHWLAEIIAVSCAATLLCTPYIISLSGQVAVLSILFNILVAPIVAPLTILGFIAVILLPIPLISWFLLIIAELFARWIVLVSEFSHGTPSWGISAGLSATLIVAMVAIYMGRKRRVIASLIIFILVGVNFLPRAGFPGADWRLAQCDVGQGDALVLNLKSGSAIVFDVGPEPALINRCLSILGITDLPLIVISHSHADHSFGLSGAVRNRTVGEIWTNGNVKVEPAFIEKVRVLRVGDRARINGIDLEILWPHSHSSSSINTTLPGDGSDENNKSLVVRAWIDGVELLVTGDIEPEAQAVIARESSLESVDILKVAHHGSRYQDKTFLDEITPRVSLISVGERNTYGHPDAGLVKYLARNDGVVLRTDQDGPISLAWRFDDSVQRYIFTMRSMRKEWWRVQWL